LTSIFFVNPVFSLGKQNQILPRYYAISSICPIVRDKIEDTHEYFCVRTPVHESGRRKAKKWQKHRNAKEAEEVDEVHEGGWDGEVVFSANPLHVTVRDGGATFEEGAMDFSKFEVGRTMIVRPIGHRNKGGVISGFTTELKIDNFGVEIAGNHWVGTVEVAGALAVCHDAVTHDGHTLLLRGPGHDVPESG
jgi:hypothetical protein